MTTLETLFSEAVALARDDTLTEAERGRRLVALLGLPLAEQRKVRLEHLYDPKTAAAVLETEERFGRYSLAPSRRPGDPTPTVREVFP